MYNMVSWGPLANHYNIVINKYCEIINLVMLTTHEL